MNRKITFLLFMIIALSSYALSFTGKKYQKTQNGVTTTIEFPTSSDGTITLREGAESESATFKYEVGTGVINIFMDGGRDHLYLDTRHVYGEDCIYILDPRGNVCIVLDAIKPSSK